MPDLVIWPLLPLEEGISRCGNHGWPLLRLRGWTVIAFLGAAESAGRLHGFAAGVVLLSWSSSCGRISLHREESSETQKAGRRRRRRRRVSVGRR